MSESPKPLSEEYLKQREEAATRAIEESMARKMGRPALDKELNPVKPGHTDNYYKPLRW